MTHCFAPPDRSHIHIPFTHKKRHSTIECVRTIYVLLEVKLVEQQWVLATERVPDTSTYYTKYFFFAFDLSLLFICIELQQRWHDAVKINSNVDMCVCVWESERFDWLSSLAAAVATAYGYVSLLSYLCLSLKYIKCRLAHSSTEYHLSAIISNDSIELDYSKLTQLHNLQNDLTTGVLNSSPRLSALERTESLDSGQGIV